jgi:hypothetical protein
MNQHIVSKQDADRIDKYWQDQWLISELHELPQGTIEAVKRLTESLDSASLYTAYLKVRLKVDL